MPQRGQVFKLASKGPDGKPLWACRYRLGGRGSRRLQRGGFPTEEEARAALNRNLDELHPRGPLAEITFAGLTDRYLVQHDVDLVTLEKLRWLLSKSVASFGERRVVDLRSEELAAWRMTVPEGHRFEATQALRQVLGRAVTWEIIGANPAVVGVENTARRRKEMRPFESWAEVDAVAARLGPVYGSMIVFAAATGLRPGEWIALERRDIDRQAGVVHVRRSFFYGRLKRCKSEASLRAVPLQAIALEALERLPPRLETPLLFPSPRGGYLDLHNFRARAWKPAQLAAGIEPLRRPYDLRHTFATFALRGRPAALRPLPLHGHELDNDRPPLRPPRPRCARARHRPARCTRGERRRLGCPVDARWTPALLRDGTGQG